MEIDLSALLTYYKREDIQQAPRYAAWRIDETELTLTNA